MTETVTAFPFEIPGTEVNSADAAGGSFAAVLPFTTSLVAVLWRYCGGNVVELRAGTTFAMSPLRVDVSGDPSLDELSARVRAALSDSFSKLPGGKTFSGELRFILPQELRAALRRSGFVAPPRDDGRAVELSIVASQAGLSGMIEYSDREDESAVRRFVSHLLNGIAALSPGSGARLSDFRVLDGPEEQEIIEGWNATACAPRELCVHQLFDLQAERTPNATALIQGSRRVTWSELNAHANQIAHCLRKRGAGPEVFVGLCASQSLQAIAGILGILKAGAAYVPLDPGFPAERLQEIAADSGITTVVTTGGMRDRVPPGLDILCLDSDAAAIALEEVSAPAYDSVPDNAAYVLYTSGSTGEPKGVIGIHRSITNGLDSVTYATDEVCCLNAFFTFGLSIANLFLPLLSGIPLAVPTENQLRDVIEFVNLLEREKITRIVLVPPVFRTILDLGPQVIGKLRHIRAVSVVGSELTPALLKQYAEAIPHARLHNTFSSTEIGTLATVWRVDADALKQESVSVGRPVANTRIYILDDNVNPVPAGAVGELYVGAPHLSRGYLNRPRLTAERFVPDPFTSLPGGRIYRTGDLGRFRPNGEIELVGRADEQLKIRGFRVEPAEVERAIETHEDIRQAVVCGREIQGQLRLVAYAVTNARRPGSAELRGHLGQSLPEYMVPTAFVFLDRMPLTSNGKIDRRALPGLEAAMQESSRDEDQPRDSIEAAVAGIWTSLLGLGPAGIHDNFLDLGGDSLFAAQVLSRVRDRFGVELSLEAMFDAPTIAGMADRVRLALEGLPAEAYASGAAN